MGFLRTEMALTQLQKNIINTYLQENVSRRENEQGGSGWAWLVELFIKSKPQQKADVLAWIQAKKATLQAIDTAKNKLEHDARIVEEVSLLDATEAGL